MNTQQHREIVRKWKARRQLLPNGKVLRWVDSSSAITVEPSKLERQWLIEGKEPDWHQCVRYR